MKVSKVLVKCSDYNGSKDVLFMMRQDDNRLVDYSNNYEVLSDAKYSAKTKTLIANKKSYRVFCDWSVKAI